MGNDKICKSPSWIRTYTNTTKSSVPQQNLFYEGLIEQISPCLIWVTSVYIVFRKKKLTKDMDSLEFIHRETLEKVKSWLVKLTTFSKEAVESFIRQNL